MLATKNLRAVEPDESNPGEPISPGLLVRLKLNEMGRRQVGKRLTRIRRCVWGALLAGISLALAGCAPPGNQALLEGRALMAEGDHAGAAERLAVAASILPTNAQVWNYLGLARHQAGQLPQAVEAYSEALRLDRDLFEARFNLGCLWLEQGRAEQARNEFTACTLRRATSLDSWIKLGQAQYRLGDFAGAEASYLKARGLDPNHPETLNGLGLVSAQRKRPREAAQYFHAALKQSPDLRSARLNLAVVLQRDLADPAAAIEQYRQYLALQPPPPDASAVKGVVQSLERQLAAKAAVAASLAAATNAPTNNAKATPATVVASVPTKTNPPVVATKPPATNAPPSSALSAPPPAPALIQTPAPVVATSASAVQATTAVTNPPSTSLRTNQPVAAASPKPKESSPPAAATSEKRSFLSRLNPFRRSKPPASSVEVAGANAPARNTAKDSEPAPSFPRYRYASPAIPAVGNRAEALAALERGRQAELAGRLTQANQAYLEAAKADPASYEAHYRLALAQYAARDYPAALVAWENCVAVRPDSADARYNFAATLQSAGYAVDAAAELEKLLEIEPRETRGHLALGNLCAEQLRDKPRARVHYLRILELAPQHPQAAAIRYWLVANPG